MNPAPFISICIPAYQRPDPLERLLRSIRRQDFKDYEVIITDDTPGTEAEAVVAEFSDLPLHYFRNQPAAGTPGNWNRALEKARAPWVQVMHADDWYASEQALSAFARACRESRHSFVFCSSREVDPSGNIKKQLQLNGKDRKKLESDTLCLVADNLIGHPSVLVHRADKSLLYNTAYKWVVDIEFYIRYLEKHSGFTYIGQPLINIGMDNEQVSAGAYKNPAIEIPEYLGMISQFMQRQQTENPYVFKAIWNLVKKFRIPDWNYMRQQGYTGPEMPVVDFIIRQQQGVPRIIMKQTDWSARLMNRAFRKWIRFLRSSATHPL